MEVIQDTEQLNAFIKKVTIGPGQVSDLHAAVDSNTTESNSSMRLE